MTNTTYTLRPQDGRFRLFWLWLTTPRSRIPAADSSTLSDHMRRDIGSPRDAVREAQLDPELEVLRYSG